MQNKVNEASVDSLFVKKALTVLTYLDINIFDTSLVTAVDSSASHSVLIEKELHLLKKFSLRFDRYCKKVIFIANGHSRLVLSGQEPREQLEEGERKVRKPIMNN